jgi:hypothetical protein
MERTIGLEKNAYWWDLIEDNSAREVQLNKDIREVRREMIRQDAKEMHPNDVAAEYALHVVSVYKIMRRDE